jgi:type IV secretory pathway VirJ component
VHPLRYLRAIIACLVLIVMVQIGGSMIIAPGAMRGAGAPTSLPVDGQRWRPISEQRLSHGRFENFSVYAPHATPKGVVLLLSGADGWNQDMDVIARRLAEQGAMVAGLDVAQFNASLESDGGQCVFPDGDLENLSHFVQAYFRLPTYLSPILAGYSAGATLAYATLVQAPKGTFAGAVSLGFCPSYGLNKPLCKGSGIEFTPRAPAQGHVDPPPSHAPAQGHVDSPPSHAPAQGHVDFLPSKQVGNTWIVLQDETHPICDLALVRSFVAQVPGAQLIPVPGPGGAASPAWSPQYASAFDQIMDQHPASSAAAVPSVLGDLPIVTVPAQPGSTPSDTFAIILSGDGGWAGLDKDVATALAASGIPVIGLDSLRYFWNARTPQGLADDIDRMTRYYLAQLGRQRVLLIGYSQGADVLPFAVNRLSATTRPHLALTALMGMSEHALFEFHVSSWISDDNSGPATLPEVDRISGVPVLCIYGQEETDTLCPKLDPHKAIIVKLGGGHHFDGDYANLARIILTSAKR